MMLIDCWNEKLTKWILVFFVRPVIKEFRSNGLFSNLMKTESESFRSERVRQKKTIWKFMLHIVTQSHHFKSLVTTVHLRRSDRFSTKHKICLVRWKKWTDCRIDFIFVMEWNLCKRRSILSKPSGKATVNYERFDENNSVW